MDAYRFAIVTEPCDSTDIDMLEYLEDCIHAARLYLLKESDDTIPAARRHMKM